MALFGEKYGDMVRVVSIADYSKEFCGGTHLDFTGKIGSIYITSESSVGSGLRRIEAFTGKLAYEYAKRAFGSLDEAAEKLKTRPDQLNTSLDQLIARVKNLEKESSKLKEKDVFDQITNIVKKAPVEKNIKKIVYMLANLDANLLRQTVDKLKELLPAKGVFVVASENSDNCPIICACTPDLAAAGFDSGALLKKIASLVGGSGGGRKDFAQGGTKNIAGLKNSWTSIEDLVKSAIEAIGETR
ncbi:MAG TPA: DHHA1 domain-containing protein, partial [Candidatus Omnitrophota bacterium]|nr:DHHA1 domain-containing protein [Candidatus Omnitrophota bacterium]